MFNGHSLLVGAVPLPRNSVGADGRLRKRVTIERHDQYYSDHSGRSMFVGEFGPRLGASPSSSGTTVSAR